MKKNIKTAPGTHEITSENFIKKLKTYQSDEERKKYHRFFSFDEKNPLDDQFIGVRMGQVFALGKEFIEMSPAEIEKLLESDIHEVRAGGVSIMDKQARSKKTPESRLKELFDLYMRRHDRINNWDLVDLGSLYLVGCYLADKPKDVLYKLAKSKNVWERRTSIVSTAYLIRKGEVDTCFKIAEMLINDKQETVNKGTGWMLRFAGDKDKKRLLVFLDKHAATMPRIALRYAIEKLDKKQRSYYMDLKN